MKNFKEFMETVDSDERPDEYRADVAIRKFSATNDTPTGTSASHKTGSAIQKGGARFFSTKKKAKVEIKDEEED